MKYLFILLFCYVSGNALQAQYTNKQAGPSYKWAVRFNAFGLADPLDTNISIGGEYAFHPGWSLTTDLSYLFYSNYIQGNKGTSGYIIKPAIRFYPAKKSIQFLEANVFYKQVNYRMEDWLGKDAVNGVASYEEYESFVFRKRVAGLNLQTGVQSNLSRDKLLRLEVYVGLGVRFRWQEIKNHPRAIYRPNLMLFNPPTDSFSALPSVPFAMRLVYCIR